MIQTTINGLSLGASYALLAVGYTLVFGIMRLLTLAHGEIFMASGVLTLLAASSLGLPLIVALLFALAVGALLSAVTDFVSFRPVGYSEPIAAAVSTIGLGLIIANGLQQIRKSETPVPAPTSFLPADWTVGGLVIAPTEIAGLLLAGLVMVATLVFLHASRWGAAMRAFSSDPDAVALLGVPVRRLTLLTLGIAGALAGLAAMLTALRDGSANPLSGLSLGITGLAVMTIGGIGSLQGAVIAGIGLGLAQTYVEYAGAGGFRSAVPWVLLLVVLLARPGGLLGEAHRD